MSGELVPETVVEESRYWTIAKNLNQNLIGRLILVLNRDEVAVTSLSLSEWSDLQAEIARTRGALDALFQPDQYNYAFLMNQDAQVHFHVVPRYAGQRTGQARSSKTSITASCSDMSSGFFPMRESQRSARTPRETARLRG